jgi:hypothetical protein
VRSTSLAIRERCVPILYICLYRTAHRSRSLDFETAHCRFPCTTLGTTVWAQSSIHSFGNCFGIDRTNIRVQMKLKDSSRVAQLPEEVKNSSLPLTVCPASLAFIDPQPTTFCCGTYMLCRAMPLIYCSVTTAGLTPETHQDAGE